MLFFVHNHVHKCTWLQSGQKYLMCVCKFKYDVKFRLTIIYQKRITYQVKHSTQGAGGCFAFIKIIINTFPKLYFSRNNVQILFLRINLYTGVLLFLHSSSSFNITRPHFHSISITINSLCICITIYIYTHCIQSCVCLSHFHLQFHHHMRNTTHTNTHTYFTIPKIFHNTC